MYRKVVIHRLTKKIQIDFENTEQLRYWNESIENEFKEDVPAPKGASLNTVLVDESEVVAEQ